MAKFLVKTNPLNSDLTCRTLEIEADKFELSNSFTYDFYAREAHKEKKLVASLPGHGVFLVTTEEALTGDCLDTPGDADNTDDVCLHCKFVEFLDSPEFFDEVYNIVDFYHSPDEEDDPPTQEPEAVEAVPVPETPTAVPDVPQEPLAKAEFRSYFNSPAWGVSAEGHFIPFGGDAYGKESAEGNAQDYKPGEWKAWCSEPIENCPLIEEAK